MDGIRLPVCLPDEGERGVKVERLAREAYTCRRLDERDIESVLAMNRNYREGFICREQGLCRFFLTAYQNNAGANALYQKLGGQVSGESQGKDTVYHFPMDTAF